MKNKLIVLLCLCLLIPCIAHANDLGYVVDTDITAFIDSSPIKSYNYKNNTFIVAEDLADFGFLVVWSEAERSLKVSRQKLTFAPFVDEFVNTKKNAEIGKRLFDVYPTDIKTYLDGELIPSYNVGGQTIIGIDYLYKYGICSYDDAKRQYYVDILGLELEGYEEKVYEDEYKTVTEKGIFEEGKLVYGKRSTVNHTRFGDTYKTETGDFKNQKYITYTDNFMAVHIKSTAYKNGDLTAFCINDDTFKYGLKLNYKNREDGNTDRYLIATGEKYLTLPNEANKLLEGNVSPSDYNMSQSLAENPYYFNGMLYKNGNLVYEGELKVELASFDKGFNRSVQYYDKHTAAIIYASGYTDQNGVIYYFDNFDSVYYEGNVVNGVAHGYGKVFNKQSGNETQKQGTYSVYDENKSYTSNFYDVALIYEGNFRDNLLSGHGALYAYGMKIFEGEFLNNQKNGHGRCYNMTSSGSDMDALVIYYDGNFENDLQSGYGVEYAEKGWAFYGGVYTRFDGDWQNGSWKYGKSYGIEYIEETNSHKVYLDYEGEYN